jgi:transcriptional regulator with XRE-family HTH domain
MKLEELLSMRSWTQARLARRAGFEPSYISHLIAGTRKPSLPNLVRLADALNVSVDAILGRSAPSPVAESLIQATDRDLLDELERRIGS